MSNRTITYNRFKERFSPLMGVIASDLQTDEAAMVESFFNGAVRTIWEYARWPDICVIESRTPNSSYVIEWEQTGQTEIESVFGIYDYDPHGTINTSDLAYDIIADGVKLKGSDQTTDAVYVWYRKRVPDYTGSDYSATTTYAVGDQVYYSTTGDFYKCASITTGNAPTSTTYWTRLTIPYRFIDYCVYAAYADWLRNDGQNGKAAIQDSLANRALLKELDRLEREEGYNTQPVTTTHLSEYDNT